MKPAWPTPSPSTRPCSSPLDAVPVSGWSEMIDNSPQSAPAAPSATSGKPTALTFYLNNGRIHVGDIAKATEDAFTAWVLDRSAGLDAIMLAPTRQLVAELNRCARAHRLDHSDVTAEVSLADGNRASVGDLIITRSNDRRLRLTATDWVKNGDRWTITR